MLNINIDAKNGIAVFSPAEKLTVLDFKNATKEIDFYLDEHNSLNGLIINTEAFPGWESFAALQSHLSFVKDHHMKIACIALVTNSHLPGFAEKIAGHFIAAKIKAFKFGEFNEAKKWIHNENNF